MRLESVFGPDALHARVADAPLFCHGAHAPVRGVDGTLFHGLLDDLEFDRCADWLPAGRFGATFHESFDSGFGEILLPAPYRGLGNAEEAQAAEERSDIAAAERLYRRVMKMDPADPAAPFNLGNVLRSNGRNLEAETAYRA